MAQSYVAAVRAQLPQGPYCLLAFCWGRAVAYEMCRLLLNSGERVGLLAIIDAPAPGWRWRREPWSAAQVGALRRNAPLWLRNTWQQGDADVTAAARWRARATWLQQRLGKARLRRGTPPAAEDWPDPGEDADPAGRIEAAHMRALAAYRPVPSDAHVVLYTTLKAMPLFGPYDWTLGWGDLAQGGVEVVRLQGDHVGVLHKPHVQAMADDLRARLAALSR